MKEKLGEICDILNGFAFKSNEYVNNGIRIIRITNVKNGYIEDSDPKYYPESQEIYIQNYLLKENDILISLTGNVGRVAMLPAKFLPAALNQRVACLRIKKDVKLDRNYLYYHLNNNIFEKNCINASKGIAQKNLSTEWLQNYTIKIPIMLYQNKISNILDKVTNLIELRKKQLEKLDIFSKALFVEMFGDPVKNPMKWKKDKLMNLGYLGRGISKHRPRNDPKLLGGKYPLIQTGDISKNDLFIDAFTDTYSEDGLKQSKLWNKNTLCITIAANIAKTSILAIEACFPDSIVGFIPEKKIDNIFLHYWFKFFQKILEEQAPESAQKNINLKILSNLNVIVPPIELQNKFVEKVKHIDKIKSDIQDSLNKLDTLKKSLMQEYFS
jgi:type I restriction enzyme, S subunit